MSCKLSILIPTLENRKSVYINLRKEFHNQIAECEAFDSVEVLSICDSGEMRIGEKRNELLSLIRGEYFCFFDDDDEPSKDYIKKILEAIKTNPDCCSLMGVYTINDEYDGIFEHSLKYKEWRTTVGDYPKYERPPNHLNVIKTELGIKYKFIPVNHGEDCDWSMRIAKDEVLKTESVIEGVIYHYKHISNK